MSTSSASSSELLREVARLYIRAQRVVAGCCKTTNTQCHILTELGRVGPMPLSELGTRLMLEKSWISRAVDGLVKVELVSKLPNPDDARSWLVNLTPAGAARVEELNRTLDGHAEQLLATLSEGERGSLNHSLLLLLKVLRADDSAMCCLPTADRQESSSCL